MKTILKALTGVAALLASNAVFSCDITLTTGTSGAVIQQRLSSLKFPTVCLSAGSYNLGSTTLTVPNGKTLKGVGATRDDVVVQSSAARMISIESNTTLQNFTLQPTSGHLPEFGVFSYYKSSQIVWGLNLKGSLINFASVGSSDVNVWDTFMSDNGGSSSADPNVWITNSTDVEFLWGAVYGEGFHPSGGGDGEIAAYDSTDVRIYGTQVINSGASAIYLVNCDSCRVESATLLNAAGWGLDVVQGSDNFTAVNNLVQNSQYGGSVFQQNVQTGGTYTGNTFTGNNTGGYASCNAINVAGNPAALTVSGNTANPGPITCVQ